MKVYDPISCMLVEKSDVKKNTTNASKATVIDKRTTDVAMDDIPEKIAGLVGEFMKDYRNKYKKYPDNDFVIKDASLKLQRAIYNAISSAK